MDTYSQWGALLRSANAYVWTRDGEGLCPICHVIIKIGQPLENKTGSFSA